MIFMGFTRNFNYCMDSARYSSYRFAKILGVNLQSVSNWKNGVVVPHPKTRQKIADHFGIALAELDGDELPVLPEQGAKKAPATEGEGKDALDIELRKIWDSSDLDDRKAILEYAYFIKGRKTK